MARPQPVGPLTCRSEKGKYAGGVAPRARPSALLGPYSPLLGPGPAASRPPYLPEQEGQVRGGGRPPGPEERPRLPLLAHRPPRDNPPTRPSRPPYSGV